MRRAAIIVLDGLGSGPRADTAAVRRCRAATPSGTSPARWGAVACRSSSALGWGAVRRFPGCRSPDRRRRRSASVSRRAPARTARPVTGSSAASCCEQPFPTYPRGFPEELIAEFSRRTGRGVLGNKAGVRHRGPRQFGEEHQRTGRVDRLHLGRQRLSGGRARGHGARRGAVCRVCRSQERCCTASMAFPGSSRARSRARPGRGCEPPTARTSASSLRPPLCSTDLAEAHDSAGGCRQGGRSLRRPRHLEHPHRDQCRGVRAHRCGAANRCAVDCCSPT